MYEMLVKDRGMYQMLVKDRCMYYFGVKGHTRGNWTFIIEHPTIIQIRLSEEYSL